MNNERLGTRRFSGNGVVQYADDRLAAAPWPELACAVASGSARLENAPVGEEAIITLRSLHHPLLVAASLAVAFGVAGCATSDPLKTPDLGTDDAGSIGAAGATGTAQSPAGGSTGTAGTPGTAGSPGNGGSPGTAGTKASAGTAGNGGTGVAPTFTQIYNDIIVKYCAGSACHNPGRSGGASFRTKSSAYSMFSQLSVPGDAADSDSYYIIASDPPFMPPRDPIVPPDGVAELAAWISAGAQNN